MDAEEKTDMQEQKPNNPHDKGYKRIFSIKRNFLDFIKKYVGFDWMTNLTEDDLEVVNKEFITDQFDTYESDLVYKVNTKEGIVYLFFLLEFQSSNDFTMPFRLLVYMTAIWLDYFKNSDEKERKRKEYQLPAIMPIVLHNGGNSWTASHRFQEMIGHADLFGKYVVDFEYIVVSVKELSFLTIMNTNTLVDNIFYADKNRTKKEWMDRMPELMRRVGAMNAEDINAWAAWFLNAFWRLGKAEREQFIRQLKEGDEKGMCSSIERVLNQEKAEGKAEGKTEGKAEGKAEFVIELLEDVGTLSDALREEIMNQTDLEILRKWHKVAARAETIEEFERAIGLVET